MERLMTIIEQMKQIHHGKGWIGVNFEEKVNGLSDAEFFDQVKGLHSIAEIIAHLTTWRLETILKIKTGKGSITDDDPRNWRSRDELKQMGKDEILFQYDQSFSELLSLLDRKKDSFLDEIYYDTDFKGNYPYSFVVKGMLHHDLYHLGQLGLLIKWIRSNSNL